MEYYRACPECYEPIFMDPDTRIWHCDNCGFEINDDDFDIYSEDSDVPGVCEACGGPYPMCRESCKIFDD